MLKLLLLPLLMFGLVASAAGPLRKAALKPANRGETLKKVECEDIYKKEVLIAEIEQLKSMAIDHHSGVNSFLDDITTRLEGWHKVWVEYEGQPGAVPSNTFATLKKSAEEIGEVQNNVIWKNLGSVEDRFNAVLECLEKKK